MSKLVQRLERLGRDTPAPMGFGLSARRQPPPQMLLLASCAAPGELSQDALAHLGRGAPHLVKPRGGGQGRGYALGRHAAGGNRRGHRRPAREGLRLHRAVGGRDTPGRAQGRGAGPGDGDPSRPLHGAGAQPGRPPHRRGAADGAPLAADDAAGTDGPVRTARGDREAGPSAAEHRTVGVGGGSAYGTSEWTAW